ncbi:MAG: hypothetical protein WCD70_09415 [Alphaproteobacteria bacterium]
MSSGTELIRFEMNDLVTPKEKSDPNYEKIGKVCRARAGLKIEVRFDERKPTVPYEQSALRIAAKKPIMNPTKM